jgi:hypothetical protein
LCHHNTVLKKAAAILLIAILAFNWYGYRIVTTLLADKADEKLVARIDREDYDESQLIEVKVALNMPYQNEQADFERHYGEMEINGKYYTYVKRKVQGGYLILKCIPNADKEKIRSANNDYFKVTNGLDGNQPDKKQNNSGNFAKNFWSEYDDRETDYSIAMYAAVSQHTYAPDISFLTSNIDSGPAQPPELI